MLHTAFNNEHFLQDNVYVVFAALGLAKLPRR